MGRSAHQQCAEDVAIDVAVIGQHAWSADGQFGVLRRGEAVVGSERRIVDRSYGDPGCGEGSVGLTVVAFVREAVGTVVVERRGIGETAVAVQGEGAVRRAADQDRGQRVAIDVAVVGQDTGGADRESGVFRRGVADRNSTRLNSTHRYI